MDGTAHRMGGVVRRASITAAVSAAMMAGLHYAPLRGFSPGALLFGPEKDVATLAPAPPPGIRFIAIPAREAFGPKGATPPQVAALPAAPVLPAAPAHPAQATLTASLPATVSVVPTARPAYCGEGCRTVRGAPPAPLGVSVLAADASPARRGAPPEPLARQGMIARPGAAPPIPVPPAATRMGAAPELALAGEAIPEPETDQRRFALADLVPDRRSVLRGVVSVSQTVGDGALSAVTGIADGALAIVGR